ncbi:dihydroorotate dehydrogenase electron transfer subunit [Lachnospiraceae bacterium ZAX-1]
MTHKFKEQAVIISQKKISNGIYSIWLKTDNIAKTAKAGQFISLYCHDGSRLLPRPISICEINSKEDAIRMVYRIAGNGTEEFSNMDSGMQLKIVGPLGNGFPVKENGNDTKDRENIEDTKDREAIEEIGSGKGKAALIIGGGIGIPPMLALAKRLNCEKNIILGYQGELFLQEEFKGLGNIYIATEDGSYGTKGNVLDSILEHGLRGDIIYACGPMPMLRAVKKFAADNHIECYISLEEKMACGIGACLSCVCKSKNKDAHTNVNNKRICKEGPVFLAEEVEI